MPSIINASTLAPGLVHSGDASGVLQLQSNGVTGITVTGANVAIAGNLTVTNKLTTSSLPVGAVLQVATAYKTDVQTITNNLTFVDIAGLTITITPTSSSSKFLILWNVALANGTDQSHGYIRLVRNGTNIGLADAAGSRTPASSAIVNTGVAGQINVSSNSFLDSPNTSSSITYKLMGASNNVGGLTYVNRSLRDTDLAGYDGRATSSLTVFEIAG